MIRVAIIGTGNIAAAHVKGLGENQDRAELVAASDLDTTRGEGFCREKGIPRFYDSTERMLEIERPGLVCLCTPPSTHMKLAIAALEAGAWVLCEKPLCGSLAELDRIQDAERRTGNRCACVFQQRFGSGTSHLRELMAAGRLGKILIGLCHTLWYRPHSYYAVPWRGKWATELGGPTVGHGIHAMDQFLYIMGPWETVQASTGTLDRNIEVEDVSLAIAKFQNGAMASIVNSVLSPREETCLRLDFQRATVELKHRYGYTNADWTYTPVAGVGEEEVASWRNLPLERSATHASQISSLLDDIEADREPLTAGDNARATIEFLTAIYKAALTGSEVARGTIRSGDPVYEAFHGGRLTQHPQQAS